MRMEFACHSSAVGPGIIVCVQLDASQQHRLGRACSCFVGIVNLRQKTKAQELCGLAAAPRFLGLGSNITTFQGKMCFGQKLGQVIPRSDEFSKKACLQHCSVDPFARRIEEIVQAVLQHLRMGTAALDLMGEADDPWSSRPAAK